MKRLAVALSLFAQVSYACPIGKTGLSKADLQKQKKSLQSLKASLPKNSRNVATLSINTAGGVMQVPVLPTAQSPQPWGGANTKNWKAEAVLANAMSRALNEGWKQPDVQDVLVSAPVRMIFTGERVYWDGQTNASVSLGSGWAEKEPQLVATLLRFKNGERKVSFVFSSQVKFGEKKISVIGFISKNGAEKSSAMERSETSIDVQASAEGWRASWTVPQGLEFGGLNTSRVIWVKPAGWDSAFPIDFRMPIYTTSELVKAAGSAKTAGRTPLDPMGAYEQAKKSGQLSTLVLLNTSYGPEWIKNSQGGNELRNESIHGEVHVGGKETKTAVGGGLTWLVERGSHSTFKNLYTCFDQRNFAKESEYGVPSGGGWHEIGDAAETIINDLESSPVVVGFATGLPWAQPPDGLKFPWELRDVATIRFLFPGESVMTPAGDQTWKEDEAFRASHDGSKRGIEPSGGGRNYHWFFFHTDTPVCTQEWVHHCLPTEENNFGLQCP